MTAQPIVVLITAPSKDVGRTIAAALVEQKLAACVNILGPIQSIYTWEGRVQEEEEFLLVAKTWDELFEPRLIPAVRAVHPYEVPEIIALPILAGLPEYLDWMREVSPPQAF